MLLSQKNAPHVSLRSIFAVILLFVMLVPLSGVYFFRVLENELIRQTESELIAQGAFIAALYKEALAARELPEGYGRAIDIQPPRIDEKYSPLIPILDLKIDPILPSRQEAVATADPLPTFEIEAGKKIHPILEDVKLSTLTGFRVINPKGVAVAGTGEVGMSFADIQEVTAALKGTYTSVLRARLSDKPEPPLASISRAAKVRVFVAVPIIFKDRVIGAAYLSRSPRNIMKALYDERSGILFTALFGLVIIGLIGWVLTTMIGSPLKMLTRHAQQLADGGEPQTPFPTPYINELAILAHNFDVMAKKIDERSTYIRTFAMHLAHEFKSPLTSIQGAIELLREHSSDMLQNQRTRFMDNIVTDTDRLKSLVLRLLELARADVMDAGTEVAQLGGIFELLKRKYADKINIVYAEEALCVNAGTEILETAFSNLIENSLSHGADTITISVSSAPDETAIHFVDNGRGISVGNASKLFTPFFTTRREDGGTGLGLVISRSLLRACDGSIEYILGEQGAHFCIQLKTAM